MERRYFTLEILEGLAWVGLGKFETKSMTTFSSDALSELDAIMDQLVEMDRGKNLKGLIFFSHKDDCFLAGVDVSTIASLSSEMEATLGPERMQSIYNKIDDLSCPTLAAIHGTCLGGGLELALACKTIIASDAKKTQLGLPEVKLGLLPGAGGTYRLPRRVGLPSALDMVLTGKNIDAKKAQKMGLVDWVMPKERLMALAPSFLGRHPQKKHSLKAWMMEKLMGNFIARKVIFQKARESVLGQTQGFYPAPLKMIDVIEDTFGRGRRLALAKEARAFGELYMTAPAASLRHLFFLMDAGKKIDKSSPIAPIKRGAVLGAGVMGGGIAWLLARQGQSPFMKDIHKDGLELGLKQSAKNLESELKKRRMSKDEFERFQRSITPTLSYAGFREVDLVVEAVVERMDVKKNVFSELENHVRPDAIITSNTSSLSIADMSTSLVHPERFAGLHFFNPVNRMPLVEIITHDKVSGDVVKRLFQWCLDVKKTPIIVKDGPGFLVNRILAPFLNESTHLLNEGVSPKDLDEAVKNFGMPMGACRLMDEIGFDVMLHAGETMEKAFGARMGTCTLMRTIVGAGFLGKKNNRGFYLYDAKGKPQGLNEEIAKFLPDKKIKLDDVAIQMRTILPMINEAARCLDDGIVAKADTVDLGLVFGIGFPPFRGGLLAYADQEGLDRILAAMETHATTVNAERFQAAPYLKKLVANQKTFYHPGS